VTPRDLALNELSRRLLRGTEESALALLAGPHPQALESLAALQLPSGAWPCDHRNQPPNNYHTALALLALRRYNSNQANARAGISWLLTDHPAEAHWLWKWKFRLVDRQVQFDPNKYGWSWVPGTVSWVAPTALALLALRAWNVQHPRVSAATAMLLNRACPAGGWNAGNAVVFGVDLDPHPDFTAMALLGLCDEIEPPTVQRATRYLMAQVASCQSAYTLAWATMALAVHQPEAVETARRRLQQVCRSVDRYSSAVLALIALALSDTPFTFQESTR